MENMNSKNEVYWLETGSVLAGRYRIEAVISEGGFGIVYLGTDLVLDINVAIKEYFPRSFAMRGEGDSALHIYKGTSGNRFQRGLDKFLGEARIQAKLNELDSIVTVRDFFYENNTAYIVSEHIVGDNVKQYIEKKGKMKAEQVLSLMKPILSSLGVIHEKGLLHRDISPDNIILWEDRAVLVDFGVSRFFLEEEDRSMTVFFKSGYSAPEQYIRRGRQGAYTDIYAVSATMYFMLTGEQPMESVQRQIKDTMLPLTKRREVDLNPHAKEAIMKGMSVSVKDRYKTMDEFCSDLFGGEQKTFRFPGLPVVSGVILAICICAVSVGGYVLSAGGDSRDISHITAAVTSSPAKEKAGKETLRITEGGHSPEQEKQYRIPSVTGLQWKAAVKRIQQNSPEGFEIVEKRIYSETVKKGRVISQSKRAGRKYRAGTIKRIVLRISKGSKPKTKKQGQQSGEQPERTVRPEQSAGGQKEKQTKNTTEDEGFAGTLPW